MIVTYEELASLAPLSFSLAEHLLKEGQMDTAQLQRQVAQARITVYRVMAKALQEHVVSLSWFKQQVGGFLSEKLQKPVPAISDDTISRWKRKGILRPPDRGQLDLSSAAAICIACLVNPMFKQRGVLPLPDALPEGEAHWYAWAQDDPTTAPYACPVPLQHDLLDAGTLLWTPWGGATWDSPAWQSLGPAGALRWAGATFADGEWIWTLDVGDLQRWDPQLSTDNLSLLLDESELGSASLQAFAGSILIARGAPKLRLARTVVRR